MTLKRAMRKRSTSRPMGRPNDQRVRLRAHRQVSAVLLRDDAVAVADAALVLARSRVAVGTSNSLQ
jgi:hypothetical protein